MDWIEHVWSFKNLYNKIFGHPLKKILLSYGLYGAITIRLCLEIIKATLSQFRKARFMLYYTSLYNRKANMNPTSFSTCDKLYKLRAKFLKTTWKPPPII